MQSLLENRQNLLFFHEKVFRWWEWCCWLFNSFVVPKIRPRHLANCQSSWQKEVNCFYSRHQHQPLPLPSFNLYTSLLFCAVLFATMRHHCRWFVIFLQQKYISSKSNRFSFSSHPVSFYVIFQMHNKMLLTNSHHSVKCFIRLFHFYLIIRYDFGQFSLLSIEELNKLLLLFASIHCICD